MLDCDRKVTIIQNEYISVLQEIDSVAVKENATITRLFGFNSTEPDSTIRPVTNTLLLFIMLAVTRIQILLR